MGTNLESISRPYEYAQFVKGDKLLEWLLDRGYKRMNNGEVVINIHHSLNSLMRKGEPIEWWKADTLLLKGDYYLGDLPDEFWYT
jgi:hypothetical protein